MAGGKEDGRALREPALVSDEAPAGLRPTGFDPARILVCGGRSYGRVADDTPAELLAAERARAQDERQRLYGVLLIHRPSLIIHGGATGADEWADYWAERNNIPHRSFPANWKRDGRAAGPIRNQRMIEEGRPGLVIAFPGGRGTADMVRRARKAGVRVLDLRDRDRWSCFSSGRPMDRPMPEGERPLRRGVGLAGAEKCGGFTHYATGHEQHDSIGDNR